MGTKVMFIKAMCVVALCLLFSFRSPAQHGTDSVSDSTVRAFFEAFNNHDVERMLSLVEDEIAWFSVMGDSLSPEIRGRSALGKWLTRYFQSLPSVRSEIEGSITSGSHVAVQERAIWMGKNGERSQVSIGVYEVFAGRIRHAWYFPAEKLTKK